MGVSVVRWRKFVTDHNFVNRQFEPDTLNLGENSSSCHTRRRIQRKDGICLYDAVGTTQITDISEKLFQIYTAIKLCFLLCLLQRENVSWCCFRVCVGISAGCASLLRPGSDYRLCISYADLCLRFQVLQIPAKCAICCCP